MSKKYYTFSWELKNRGYIEVPESEYTERQKEIKAFIEALSDVVVKANCGWDAVKYKVMIEDGAIEKFMVLCVGDVGERWIPITGNSKGAMFNALADNLW